MNYIPRTPYVPGGTPNVVPERVKKKRIIHVFSILGWAAFGITIVAFVGTYLYKEEFATQKLITAKVKLKEVSEKAREDDIRALEMIRLNSQKMQVAGKVLENHLAPSRLLTHIENLTKKRTQYKSFSYEYDPGFDAIVKLDGITDTLKSAFAQKQGYKASQLFQDYQVSKVTLQGGEVGADGEIISEDSVVFGLEGILKKDMVEYTASDSVTDITLENIDGNVDAATSSDAVSDTQSEIINTETSS